MSVTVFERVLLEEGTVWFLDEHLARRFIASHDLGRFDSLKLFGHSSYWVLNSFLEDQPPSIISRGDKVTGRGGD
jgi:hypothetical protein